MLDEELAVEPELRVVVAADFSRDERLPAGSDVRRPPPSAPSLLLRVSERREEGADRGLACAAALDLGEALVGDGINNRGLDAQPLEGRGGPLERGGDGGPEREGEERDFSIG